MAQVAIASGFFPAYAKLPRKAQRKLDEFFRKFSVDPKQPSIHYEPVQGAEDKQLRSVRIGDDYRAIVRAPESGDVFLMLHVDHHDEAYRWAEAKRTEIHPVTGTMQLFDVDAVAQAVTSLEGDEPTDTEQPSSEAEWEEKRLFSDYTDEQLFRSGVPKALLPAVRAIFTDSDLDRLAPHLPQEAADLLTGLAAGYGIDEVVEQILDKPAALAAETVEVDTTDVAAALEREGSQREFRLLDEDFDLEAALTYPLDLWRVYLHPRQRKVVRAKTKGPMRVTGAAGTGKTVVAMHRAAFLARDVFTGPDDRILFTTFTTNLAHDIEQQLGKLLEPEHLARIEVTNLDAWANQYLRKRGKALRLATNQHRDSAWRGAIDLYGVDGFSKEFYESEWREVIQEQDIRDLDTYLGAVRRFRGTRLSRADRRKLWEAFEAYRDAMARAGVAEPVEILRAARMDLEQNGEPPRYRSVVVDETQDFSTEALRLLRAIAGPEHPNDLFLVGDAHQRIYGRPVALGPCGINIRGRRSRELRLNYRTTAAICRWSVRTLGQEAFDDLDDGSATLRGYTSLRNGRAPTVRFFDDVADERDFITSEIQRLLDDGRSPDEVCVVARTKNLLTGGYGPALEKAGIVHEVLERQEAGPNTVRLATMHRVKGLEFPVVFVAAAKDGIVPLDTPQLNSSDPVVARMAELTERCLLYVASSRARDLLYVTCSGSPSPFLEGLDQEQEPPLAPSEPPAPPLQQRREPPAPPAGDLDARLAQPLTALPLPTRILTWAQRTETSTLGDLAKVPPLTLSQQRNMGRRSVAQARQVIERELGMSWEEYCRSLGHGEHDEVDTELGEATPWHALAASLPQEALNMEIQRLPLPTRMQTYCNDHHIKTVGDLVQIPAQTLVDAPNLGRTSVKKSRLVILDWVNSAEERRNTWDAGLLAGLKASMQELDSVPRVILTRRSGLGTQQETLESIAATLGVTRERVRQIEKKALGELHRSAGWVEYVVNRFQEAGDGGAVALSELDDDPWWQGVEDKIEALDYFCQRLFESGWRVTTFDGEDFLATTDLRAVEEAVASCARAAKAAKLPIPVSRIRTECEAVCSGLPGRIATAVWEKTEELLNLDEAGENVVSVGKSKRAQIKAALQAGPMRVADLMRQVGRCSLPDEVLILGRGIVGLKKDFPDFDEWQARLVPDVVRIMQSDGPDRQWLCGEILAELREDHDVPDWFGHWHLASLLRQSDEVKYLGRLRVALPGVAEDSGRILIHQALERLLNEAGEPVAQEALFSKLHQETDFNETSAALRLLRPPFLKCDRSTWGLLARDLPGGIDAMTEALDEVETVLLRKERGLSARQTQREIAKLSKSHATWTPEMCVSVARGDSRFRLSISGNIGLADWETVRVPTRAELVQRSLDESDGRVSIEAVQDRIAAIYGAAPERISVGQMANRFGAVIDGELLVRRH